MQKNETRESFYLALYKFIQAVNLKVEVYYNF